MLCLFAVRVTLHISICFIVPMVGNVKTPGFWWKILYMVFCMSFSNPYYSVSFTGCCIMLGAADMPLMTL